MKKTEVKISTTEVRFNIRQKNKTQKTEINREIQNEDSKAS